MYIWAVLGASRDFIQYSKKVTIRTVFIKKLKTMRRRSTV